MSFRSLGGTDVDEWVISDFSSAVNSGSNSSAALHSDSDHAFHPTTGSDSTGQENPS